MIRKFELGQDFCTMHLVTKFHHPVFNRSEVIVLTRKHTHKHMPLKTSTSLCYATSLDKKFSKLGKLFGAKGFPILTVALVLICVV